MAAAEASSSFDKLRMRYWEMPRRLYLHAELVEAR
jgi:hypothetical protein